jgi:chromate transporter
VHAVEPTQKTSLTGVLRRWGRLGLFGFGGPQAHTALLRQMMVDREHWMDAREFQDAVAATSLLPGPASTQLAILCARVAGGTWGAVLGGLAFILPGFALIVPLSALYLDHGTSPAIRGASAGAVAAVVVVIVHAGLGLTRAIATVRGKALARRAAYLAVALLTTVLAGPWVLLVLLGAGLVELAAQRQVRLPLMLVATSSAKLPALLWVAFKVGALSFGGGLVIIPMMQHDVVDANHWMTAAQFATAVALGQLTPGPVVLTVSAVGYGSAGVGGAALAAAVAFAPSFAMVLAGARHFERLRHDLRARAFLDGSGPAAVGAIFGAAVLLAPSAVHVWWQPLVIAAAALSMLARRSSFTVLCGGLVAGLVAALLGLHVPG